MDTLNTLLRMLIDLWVYDMNMFSYLFHTWYHYLWLGPIWYAYFFLFKWFIISAPFWIPISVIFYYAKR